MWASPSFMFFPWFSLWPLSKHDIQWHNCWFSYAIVHLPRWNTYSEEAGTLSWSSGDVIISPVILVPPMKCIVSKYFFCNIYLFTHSFICLAASGLSCGTRDLCCVMPDLSLRSMDSLIVSCGLSSAHVAFGFSTACGILVPWPGIILQSPALEVDS